MKELNLNRLALAGLLLLCIIPLLAGAIRVSQLASGAVTAENARFFEEPLPIVIHVMSVTIFCVVGAFQFVPALRLRNKWHRTMGRILVPFGLASAASGLWMNQFYVLPPHDGTILYVERLVFGLAMSMSLCLGLIAIRRRDFATHRAWMMRGYAIGIGAGTQVITSLPWMLLIGEPDILTRAILMGAGWLINVAIAEWFIRRASFKPAIT